LDFTCIESCSECCISREYYPTLKFGKVGVLVLPEEKNSIEKLAERHGISITILPRIGISETKSEKPTIVLAYQLMGKDLDGNTCPFLEMDSAERSPHGGYKCKIYQDRPLACRAYPIIESSPVTSDSKCKFCESCGTPSGKIESELESLIAIKKRMATTAPNIWRYATGIGEIEYKSRIKSGWFLI